MTYGTCEMWVEDSLQKVDLETRKVSFFSHTVDFTARNLIDQNIQIMGHDIFGLFPASKQKRA